MREDICSIPVNEVFEPKDGCPFCRMRDMLEDRMATYITGAAMMEPDVRIETNRLGFCTEHFNQILARGSRLSVALILESLLAEVKGQVFPEGKAVPKKIAAAGHPDVVVVLVTNSDDYENLSIQAGTCKVLDKVIQV